MSMQPIKYRIKHEPLIGNFNEMKQGDIVYGAVKHDYGLANEDSHTTGVLHKSVTIEPNGDYPYFTVPAHLLEEIK